DSCSLDCCLVQLPELFFLLFSLNSRRCGCSRFAGQELESVCTGKSTLSNLRFGEAVRRRIPGVLPPRRGPKPPGIRSIRISPCSWRSARSPALPREGPIRRRLCPPYENQQSSESCQESARSHL